MLKFTWTSNTSRLKKEIPQAIQEALKKAAKEAAIITKDIAKQECPVDTGYLRGSIFYRVNNPLKYTIGASANYAGYVEFGTRFMHAQPFIRPAFITVHTYLIDGIINRITDELKSI